MSLKYRYELHKWASEQLRPDCAIMHAALGAAKKGNTPEISGQMDLDVFYCPECGKKCEEEELLDGSNVGFTLLTKCSGYTCGNYFCVTYNNHSLLENVSPIGPLNRW